MICETDNLLVSIVKARKPEMVILVSTDIKLAKRINTEVRKGLTHQNLLDKFSVAVVHPALYRFPY
jgi:hypothetical protein